MCTTLRNKRAKPGSNRLEGLKEIKNEFNITQIIFELYQYAKQLRIILYYAYTNNAAN